MGCNDNKRFLDEGGLSTLVNNLKQFISYKLPSFKDGLKVEDNDVSIDENYLSDFVKNKSLQSDWNQNNDTELDYIKNRPFYDESVKLTLDGKDERGVDIYVATGISKDMIKPGDYVNIYVDGKTYSVGPGLGIITDGNIRGDQYDNMISFWGSGSGSANLYFCYNDSDETATWILGKEWPIVEDNVNEIRIGNIKQIDPKFIPVGYGIEVNDGKISVQQNLVGESTSDINSNFNNRDRLAFIANDSTDIYVFPNTAIFTNMKRIIDDYIRYNEGQILKLRVQQWNDDNLMLEGIYGQIFTSTIPNRLEQFDSSEENIYQYIFDLMPDVKYYGTIDELQCIKGYGLKGYIHQGRGISVNDGEVSVNVDDVLLYVDENNNLQLNTDLLHEEVDSKLVIVDPQSDEDTNTIANKIIECITKGMPIYINHKLESQYSDKYVAEDNDALCLVNSYVNFYDETNECNVIGLTYYVNQPKESDVDRLEIGPNGIGMIKLDNENDNILLPAEKYYIEIRYSDDDLTNPR